MDIDLTYIDEIDPDLGVRIRKAVEFRGSEYGKEVSSQIDELESSSEKTTVGLLCEGDVDGAKMSAALAAACEHIRGVLWDNVLNEGRNLTAMKEGEE